MPAGKRAPRPTPLPDAPPPSIAPPSSLSIVDLPLDAIDENPWNPNAMDDRTFEAETESVLLYGFVDPITVRRHPDEPGRWQIIDGAHRKRVIDQLAASGLPSGAAPSLRQIVEGRRVPCVVLDLSDAWAKKLTIILNETRGRATPVKLGELLSDLATSMGKDDLLKALPYTQGQIDDLISLGQFDWSAAGAAGGGDGTGTGDDDDVLPDGVTIEAALTVEDYARYKAVAVQIIGSEPSTPEQHADVMRGLLARWPA
jgi:hypothetical protein